MITFEQELWIRGVDILSAYPLDHLEFNALNTGTARDVTVKVFLKVSAQDMKDWANGDVAVAGDDMDYKAYQKIDDQPRELIWEQPLRCEEMDFTWSGTVMMYVLEGKGTRN